jgi:Uma2 family endonuclease
MIHTSEVKMQWSEVLELPYLQNLPFKIELNRFGQILMSPASNLHGGIQVELGALFLTKLPQGKTFSECSIQTEDGVRVADIAWASAEFLTTHGEVTPFPRAPEICIEITSPSNTKAEIDYKISLYFSQGAQEVWIVTLQKKVTIYIAGAVSSRSKYLPNFKEL